MPASFRPFARLVPVLLLLPLLGGLGVGCGTACLPRIFPVLSVIVRGAAELKDDANGGEGGAPGRYECTADIVVEVGDLSSPIECYGERSGDCRCDVFGSSDTYTVRVTLNDGLSEVQTTKVKWMKKCSRPITETLCFFGDCPEG